MEDPTERVQEDLHEHAGEHAARHPWVAGAALTAALLAALAAVTTLISGHHVNEAMLEQGEGFDDWSHYQAKSIKALILASKDEVLTKLGKPVSEKDAEKLKDYRSEQDEISAGAKEKIESSRAHLRHHVILARGVTMFQVAIAVAAISVLSRRRAFWYVSMLFGAAGLVFLVTGILPR